MSQPMMEKRIPVSGMTCTGCETRIEGALTALPGVKKAQASAKDGSVVVTYDPQTAKPDAFQKAIEERGYIVDSAAKTDGKAGEKNAVLAKTAGIGALILIFALLGSHFGWFQLFNLFPVATKETGLGMLFVIGLLTSVHCVAMCGGINLSQCLGGSGQGRFSGLLPSLKYNLGRVISYTVIGGIVGAIGSVVQFTGTFRGIVQLLAGVFMVLMGLSLSGLFPALGRFTPHLPKALGRKINKEKRESNSPLYVGLLNGLMPCGPLQAMQLYALSTGSIIGGATSMLLFSLGTVPLMFALGALSSILSRKFTKYMVTAGAVLVVVMGISMFQNGLALSGLQSSAGTAQSEPMQTAAVQAETTNAPSATAAGGVQEITSELTRSGYPAITVKAGSPVKWTIKAAKANLNGCNYAIVIPEYDIQKELAVGDNVIEFTPTRTGTFTYTCWMGMIRSTITVIEGDSGSSSSDSSSANALPDSKSELNQSTGIQAETKSGQTTSSGVQEITSELTRNGYPAITVKAGSPVKWTIKAAKANLNGCNYAIVIPEYDIQKQLAVGDNVIEFTPTRTGTFTYTCWMGMIRGTITVIEGNFGSTSSEASPAAASPAINFSSFASTAEPEDASGGTLSPSCGCCGGAPSN